MTMITLASPEKSSSPGTGLTSPSVGDAARASNGSIALDQWRGFALILVLFQHALFFTNRVSGLGRIGVNLFFFISGILVYRSLHKEEAEKRVAISAFLLVAASPASISGPHRVCPNDASPCSSSPKAAKPAIAVRFTRLTFTRCHLR